MRYFRKELKLDAVYTVVIQCHCYRKDNKWSLTILDFGGYCAPSSPYYTLHGNRLDLSEVRNLLDQVKRIQNEP